MMKGQKNLIPDFYFYEKALKTAMKGFACVKGAFNLKKEYFLK